MLVSARGQLICRTFFKTEKCDDGPNPLGGAGSCRRRPFWSRGCRSAPRRWRSPIRCRRGTTAPPRKRSPSFVQATTTPGPKFVAPEARVATFDQDGTLWVEHPMYTQLMFSLDRVPAVVAKKPELAKVEPFKTVLSGDHEAIAKLSMPDLEKILAATLTGMTVDQFNDEVKKWIASAKHPRWKRPYTELTYQPMLELMKYLRANGYKTYIVTGGGQDFVRVYAQQVYGVPPEQVIGTAGGIKYGYDQNGQPTLTKEPKLLLNDNDAGKPEGIHLVIGRRPYAAFGNSTGDRQMLEYTSGATARDSRCWCSTTMRRASTRTVRLAGCLTRRSARSRRRCTTKRRTRSGS